MQGLPQCKIFNFKLYNVYIISKKKFSVKKKKKKKKLTDYVILLSQLKRVYCQPWRFLRENSICGSLSTPRLKVTRLVLYTLFQDHNHHNHNHHSSWVNQYL